VLFLSRTCARYQTTNKSSAFYLLFYFALGILHWIRSFIWDLPKCRLGETNLNTTLLNIANAGANMKLTGIKPWKSPLKKCGGAEELFCLRLITWPVWSRLSRKELIIRCLCMGQYNDASRDIKACGESAMVVWTYFNDICVDVHSKNAVLLRGDVQPASSSAICSVFPFHLGSFCKNFHEIKSLFSSATVWEGGK